MVSPLFALVLMCFVALLYFRCHLLELLEFLVHGINEDLILSVPISDFVKFFLVEQSVGKQYWLDTLVIFLHDVLVFQLLFDLVDALHVGVHYLGMLFAVAFSKDV